MDTSLTDPRREDRVREHTAPKVNERIDRLTQAGLDDTTLRGRDAMIARLCELDREWDVDRALMANFAVLGSLTFALGKRVHRGFMWLFGAQQLFLLMHAVVGWCPPLPVFRRLGFRTSKEIADERQRLMHRLETLD